MLWQFFLFYNFPCQVCKNVHNWGWCIQYNRYILCYIMGIWAQYTSIVIPLTGAYVCSTCLLWYTFEIRCLVQYKFKMCALIHAVFKKCFKPECVFLQKCLNKWPKCFRQTTVFYMTFSCRGKCIFIKYVILLNDVSLCLLGLYDLLKSLVSSRVACKPVWDHRGA